MTKAKYDAVDCQGFAGGFTMGMVQAGFHLVGKKEMKGGFGVPNCEANRHLLGDDWEADVTDPDEWTPIPADVIFGNPPCSGFSLLSRSDFRGPDSPINACMYAFVDLVARTKPLPQLAIFESVQQAYTGGLVLMRALREKLEEDTGEKWNLHHVLHNNASVGGAAIRKRYFWVVSRIPFGIEPPVVKRVPTLMDVIGDLQGLNPFTWEKQPYRRPPTWWSKSRRSVEHGVCGHVHRDTPAIRRALDLMDGTHWDEKEHLAIVARRYYEKHGKLPDSWHNAEKVIKKDFQMGFNQIKRWRGDRMARVITGGGVDMVLHPYEDRPVTHREVARIQGFPDDWKIRPLRGAPGLQLTWGKGIPVDCGRWIGEWIHHALDGNPGPWAGEPMDQEREFEIDVTNAYRAVSDER